MIKRIALLGYGAIAKDVLKALRPLLEAQQIAILVHTRSFLSDADLYAQLLKVTQQFKRRILLPAGAIAGLDYLQSIQGADELRVIYESHKPVAAWLPELAALGIEPESLKEPLMLFEGSAAAAATRYPQNLNVAATLALAGIGMEQTQVRVVVDPQIRENRHHLLIRSEYGEMHLQLSNTPSPNNPKSSWMVAQSIAAVVKKEFAPLKIA
ncbi:L-aspartate dehydrogenase [Oligella sp. MSHR50489EDL]|uniref:aspartate dehydrogenase domain-containing protein n=1 Tax=Oligella sp. MSHR50489EDL TaxID=3139409 RepID=UPI003D81A62D